MIFSLLGSGQMKNARFRGSISMARDSKSPVPVSVR